ncbi:hypothetical protein CT690_19925 [Serratia plymuthica]|uniref:Uncharacterized protein n=1 Tax=Serratia plymuthica TaxID=82996 RepID=A0A318PCB3_SERPL|nr:hypothetical protein CT690_19925 [Serratia plymuthica]
MFKPDNTECGLLGRDPKGWGHLNAHRCYEPLIWPTKPHDSCLVARSHDRQRCSRATMGRNPYFPGNQQVFCHAGGENAQ